MIPRQEPAFSPGSRRASLERLRTELFDVLILGGGINGAGIARDLALRARQAGTPLRIGLVEQRHFASGTSGKNSQLIHGGLRYLKQLEFGLVREALEERATLLRIAPHLVEPLPFLIPFYGWGARVYYGTGLMLYDWLAGRRNVGKRRFLYRKQVRRLEPALDGDGLTSAGIYFDCRVNAARFVLENLFDAARDGAIVANYTKAGEVTRDGGQFRVRLADQLGGETFEARARKVVDTTGPWQSASKLRLVRGSHLVFSKVSASSYAIAHFAEDGRIIFVIPWGPGDSLSLAGTTDCDHAGGPDDVRISADEIRYLVGILRRLFPQAAPLQPLAAYSSLRPLLRSEAASATKTSREHRIWNSPDGILRVAGGKYTTYRKMSEEAAEAVVREVAPRLQGIWLTAETPLGGNTRAEFFQLMAASEELSRAHSLEEAEVRCLIRNYGLLAPAVLKHLPPRPPEGVSRIEAAVTSFSIDHELVQRLPDLLFVSTYWGYERRWDAAGLRRLAAVMAARLGWDEPRIEEEARLTRRILQIPEWD